MYLFIYLYLFIYIYILSMLRVLGVSYPIPSYWTIDYRPRDSQENLCDVLNMFIGSVDLNKFKY